MNPVTEFQASAVNLKTGVTHSLANPAKVRIDVLLVERGLVASRERARAMILAGRVLVSEQKIDKPGATVPQDSPVRLLGEDLRYVSRGGLKLEAALAHWKIDVAEDPVSMSVLRPADSPTASCSTAPLMSRPSTLASARLP